MTNSADLLELYRFTIGTSNYYYTSAFAAVEYQNRTYQPEAISRTANSQSQSVDRATMSVTVPRGNAVAGLFVAKAPESRVGLTVFQQRGEDTTVGWVGRIVDCEFIEDEARMRAESIFTSQRRSGLQRRYQIGCPHALGDNRCGVNLAPFSVEGILSGAALNQISAPEWSAFPDQWFRSGTVLAPNGARRMIVDHQGDTLTLMGNVLGLVAGQSVTAVAGCDHVLDVCVSKFSNSDNYGGFPYFPDENPFGGSTIF